MLFSLNHLSYMTVYLSQSRSIIQSTETILLISCLCPRLNAHTRKMNTKYKSTT